ncbi:MAG: hypothetical protein AAGE01_10680 [Pseudomonadota bacterium]
MRQIVFVLAAMIFLAGCAGGSGGSKQYIKPDGPVADDCISQCNVVRTRCRTQFQDQYRACRQQYEYLKQQHDYCVSQGGTWCQQPERCKPARTQVCQDQYDGCFQQCGGIITDKPAG